MTLVEFIHPLKKARQRDVILGALYFHKRYQDETSMTAAEIKLALRQARVPGIKNWNIGTVISRSGGPFITHAGVNGVGTYLFEITATGEERVRDLLGLPSADLEHENDVAALLRLAARIRDSQAQSYVKEAIDCLRIGALRATVVFLWAGAIATLREDLWRVGASRIRREVQQYQPSTEFKKKDDFARLKDVNLLEVAENLGRIDKGEKQILQQALTVRNQCGHPAKYSIGEKRVSSLVEDIVGIVFA